MLILVPSFDGYHTCSVTSFDASNGSDARAHSSTVPVLIEVLKMICGSVNDV